MHDQEAIELRRWVDAVEDVIVRRPGGYVKRVVALAETASTQDAAREMSRGEAGLLVLAGRQAEGRGRLGRDWIDRAGLGVAATLTVRAGREEEGLVSLAGGVAAAEAISRSLGEAGSDLIGIRWPNDVVERRAGRKLAGVLIEALGMGDQVLLLLGIGINVLQGGADWPEGLRAGAVSLRELGAEATRGQVIVALVEGLERCLAEAFGDDAARDALLARWQRRDVLTGTRAAFVSAGRRVEGLVESVEPSLEIVVRTDSGGSVALPAAITSLVHPARS